ncbi:glycerol-3-phosphate dehydrogenase [Nisaea acidiphila]|uniref:Glycerol-3-phosphate dehydrogenase n=1 Tax=Nisaea acidiphila TaxID=1862145 RepID=A0A9J7AV17_9PROT|nr:glycerol-3-phosphate dehydrogenase [Nisaea acidiphila]UUX50650.1 glycerol-3-phosphate dehydrogenase [Nisaea acidiphila]
MYDIAIIGGGINGCGIARDAAGRGYSVCLAEMSDLASGTSSWSTKLIHGGLRYLEHYEFRLVRESLEEREVLWAMAPHIVRPLRFVLPHHKGLRPAWLLRLGLFLYDHLGGRKLLPPTRVLDLTRDEAGAPLKDMFRKGFEYSDCWVDDARLVALNARDAADRGADIMTRTRVVKAVREVGHWRVTLRDLATGTERDVEARLLVNAAGPWVDKVLSEAAGWNAAHNVRLVQGSHIVVPKLYDHDRCYIFQNADGRIFFSIPYEQDFTLIGTTDRDFDGDPGEVAITEEEKAYLCRAAGEYFKRQVKVEDIVWTYSGVRPLFDDGASKAQEATRDYVLREEGDPATGVLVNIFGGKLTTYRRLANSVMAKIEAVLGAKGPVWSGTEPLPGGDFPALDFSEQLDAVRARYPFLDDGTSLRLTRQYGTLVPEVLGEAAGMADLGRDFGAGLTEAEVRYLMHREWAVTAEDVLWRRSKLGLRLDKDQAAALQGFMSEAASRAA